jgi:acyl-CoA synthetase (AMP-forming)/AMP-acid ligase II
MAIQMTLPVWHFKCLKPEKKVSFGQLDARTNQVAQILRSCGVGPVEYVAMLMTNQRQFLEACFGMDRAGV